MFDVTGPLISTFGINRKCLILVVFHSEIARLFLLLFLLLVENGEIGWFLGCIFSTSAWPRFARPRLSVGYDVIDCNE